MQPRFQRAHPALAMNPGDRHPAFGYKCVRHHLITLSIVLIALTWCGMFARSAHKG